MQNPDTRYRTGDWIQDRYEIEHTHRGGMGYVLLAYDHEAKRPIAIKTFEQQFVDSVKNKQKFLQEACTWIRLERHPNIVQAHYLEIVDGSPYLFLERITSSASAYRGSTLKDFIFTRHLSEKLMMRLAIQICDGMIHAKDKFPLLVHRDLKCENILIGDDEIPKISDFGMTTRDEDDDDWDDQVSKDVPLSVLAARMEGTPAFASPEQCMGLPLDTRADIYSFGCLLYQMVARRPPFAFSTVEETIAAQLHERPVAPVDHNDDIHRDFSDFILDCMKKNSHERFDSFLEAREEIARLYYRWYNEHIEEHTHAAPLEDEEYIARGRSFVLLGFVEYAQVEYEKALFVSPANQQAQFELAKIAYIKGDTSESLKYLEKFDIASSHEPQVQILAGKNYAVVEKYELAIEAYGRAIQLVPKLSESYVGLAQAYIKVRDFDEAARVFEQGIKEATDKTVLFQELAKLYNMTGDLEKERKTLAWWNKFDPEEIKSVVRIAEICVDLGEIAQLKTWVRKAVSLNPQQPEVLFRLGSILVLLKDSKRATEVWQRAYQGGYESADFMKEYAELEFSLRKIESAWKLALRAEELGADVESLKKGIQAKRFRTMFSRP